MVNRTGINGNTVVFGKKKNQNKQKKKKTPNVGGQLLRLGGAAGGAYLGSMVGMPTLGADVGHALGAGVSRWIGWGDYKLSRNSLINKSFGGNLPGMHSNNRSVIVRHSEYVGDVKTGATIGALSSTYYPLNPGYELTFPWLSTMAQNYQEYRLKGVIFIFKSTSGDALNSTNTALGTVMMSTQYRAGASAFTSKAQILQSDFASDGKPSEAMYHGIECDPRESPYSVHYIRAGSLNSGDDVEKYDIGTFSIHTHGGQAANVTVGELWVSYEIELMKPQYASLRSPNSAYYHGFNATSNVDTTHPFGTNSFLPSALGNEVGSFTPTLSNTTITFPLGTSGFFVISWYVRGASTAITSPTIAATTNTTLVNGFLNQGSTVLNNNGTTTTTMFVSQCINIIDSSIQAVITWSGGTYPTAITNMDIYIIQVPDDGQTAL